MKALPDPRHLLLQWRFQCAIDGKNATSRSILKIYDSPSYLHAPFSGWRPGYSATEVAEELVCSAMKAAKLDIEDGLKYVRW